MPNVEQIQVAVTHGNGLVAAGLRAAFAAESDFEIVNRLAGRICAGAFSRLASAGISVTDYDAGMRLLEDPNRRKYRVLIVTDDITEVSIRLAVERGVRGYLPLSAPVDSVVRAVRLIHRGGTALDPTAMTKIAVSLASPMLTGREMEVLRLMMLGLPNKAIAVTLQRTVGTAKSHVKAILAKLDATSRVEAVAVARRRGLVRDDLYERSRPG